MKDQRPDQFEEIKELLAYLRREPDPRNPTHPRLNVAEMKWDAAGWFRAYSLRLPLRLVFRILEGEGSHTIEVGPGIALDEKVEDHAIQVMRAGERATVYNADFRRRCRDVKRGEAA